MRVDGFWELPRIWLCQKQWSWDVWIALLGMGMFLMWVPASWEGGRKAMDLPAPFEDAFVAGF